LLFASVLVTFFVFARLREASNTVQEADAERTPPASRRHEENGRGRSTRSSRERGVARLEGAPGLAFSSLAPESLATQHPIETVRTWADFNRRAREEVAASGSGDVVVFEDAELEALIVLLERHRVEPSAGPEATPADAFSPRLLDEISPRERRLLTDMGFFDPGPLSPPSADELVLTAASLRDPSRPSDSDGDE
jgi:hypothetical protein